MKKLINLIFFIMFSSFIHSVAVAGPVDWIGRVNYAGYSHRTHCTGALIAPDMVLTAAHCLISTKTGKPLDPGNVVFRAGYHLGESKVDVRGRAFVFMKGYLKAKTSSEKTMLDASIIVLEKGLDIRPARLSAIDGSENTFAYKGYSLTKPHILTGSDTCNRKSEHAGLLLVDCEAKQGQSGSPVISKSNGNIIGLIVAINGDGEAIVLNIAGLDKFETQLFHSKAPIE